MQQESPTPSRPLSVVIPVYNEAENIGPLLEEVRAALPEELDYEMVVVDDASTDGTFETLRALGERMPRLRALRHVENLGQSVAVVTGVRAASGEWIATLDGDGQNLPADIPKLLAERDRPGAPENLQLVGGIRRRRRDSEVKKWSSKVANAVRGRLLKDEFPDTGCGLKLFRRDAFLELPRFNHMHRFLPALFRRQGGAVIGVEVGHRPRLAGESKYGTWDRLRVGVFDLFGVMWLLRRPCNSRIDKQP